MSEFEYNIVDGMLLGLRASLNSTNTSAVMELISVDPATGDITPRLELPNLDSYTPDGTVFDQLNRMYVLHYYAGMGTSPHIMAIDATTWDILADNPLNQNFLELEMSNVAFADQRYSLSEVSESLRPSPTLSLEQRAMDQHDPRTAERHPNGPARTCGRTIRGGAIRHTRGSPRVLDVDVLQDSTAKSPARPSVAEDVRTSGHANVLDLPPPRRVRGPLSLLLPWPKPQLPTPVDSSWLWATRSPTLS